PLIVQPSASTAPSATARLISTGTATTSIAATQLPSPTNTAPPAPTATTFVPLVPELINASLDTARPLVEANWQLVVDTQPSDSVPEGVIIDQQPVAGTPLP